MTEKSWPWNTNPPMGGAGDGVNGLGEQASREFLALYFGVQDPTREGVCHRVLNELQAFGATSPVQIQSGAAICYGMYINDDTVNVVVPTPVVGTTGGRIVLQTNWAGVGGSSLEARTRIALKMSTDGVASLPDLTQTAGTTWEIPLYSLQITTGGSITLSDERVKRRPTSESQGLDIAPQSINDTHYYPLSVGANAIGIEAVTTNKLADGSVTTDKIANANVTEPKIGNNAVTTPKIATSAVTTQKINNGAVTNIKIGTAAVTADKIGSGQVNSTHVAPNTISNQHISQRVPKLPYRIGSGNLDWIGTGAESQQFVSSVKMVVGHHNFTSASVGVNSFQVVLPDNFIGIPMVFASVNILASVPQSTDLTVYVNMITTNSFWIRLVNNGPSTISNVGVSWQAIAGG